jgi:hypothetical protein
VTVTLEQALETHAKGYNIVPLGSNRLPVRGAQLKPWYETRQTPADVQAMDWTRAHYLGVICGAVSGGFNPIDFDNHDGEPGLEAYQSWKAIHDFPMQITHSGGIHVFCRGAAEKVKQIEFKGDRCGELRGEKALLTIYHLDLLPPVNELPEIPDWTPNLYVRLPKFVESNLEPMKPVEKPTNGGAYGRAALRGLCAEIVSAPRGESNEYLNRCAFRAGRFVAGNEIEYRTAVFELETAAFDRCKDKNEARAVIKAALESGMRYPMTAPEKAEKPAPAPSVVLDAEEVTKLLGRALENIGKGISTHSKSQVSHKGILEFLLRSALNPANLTDSGDHLVLDYGGWAIMEKILGGLRQNRYAQIQYFCNIGVFLKHTKLDPSNHNSKMVIHLAKNWLEHQIFTEFLQLELPLSVTRQRSIKAHPTKLLSPVSKAKIKTIASYAGDNRLMVMRRTQLTQRLIGWGFVTTTELGRVTGYSPKVLATQLADLEQERLIKYTADGKIALLENPILAISKELDTHEPHYRKTIRQLESSISYTKIKIRCTKVGKEKYQRALDRMVDRLERITSGERISVVCPLPRWFTHAAS